MSNKTSDKNVANIVRLNNFANMTFLYGNRVSLNKDNLKEIQQDLKQLIAELEQDKKRIQELEEQVKTLDEAYTGVIKESKKWFDIAHNSIPMQVVIDKMEELNKEIKSCDEIDAIFKIKQQQVLQELLEGERK